MWDASSHTYIHTYTVMHSHTNKNVHTYIHTYTFYCCMHIGGRISRWGRPDLPVLNEGGRLFLIIAPGHVSRSTAILHHPSPRRSRERRAPQQAPQTTHRQTHTHMVRQVTYKEDPSYIHTYPYTYMTGYDPVQNNKHTIHTPYYTETLDKHPSSH